MPPPCSWLGQPAPPCHLHVGFGPRGRGAQLCCHRRRSPLAQGPGGWVRTPRATSELCRPRGPSDGLGSHSPRDRRKPDQGAGHAAFSARSPRADLPPPLPTTPLLRQEQEARSPQKTSLSKERLDAPVGAKSGWQRGRLVHAGPLGAAAAQEAEPCVGGPQPKVPRPPQRAKAEQGEDRPPPAGAQSGHRG